MHVRWSQCKCKSISASGNWATELWRLCFWEENDGDKSKVPQSRLTDSVQRAIYLVLSAISSEGPQLHCLQSISKWFTASKNSTCMNIFQDILSSNSPKEYFWKLQNIFLKHLELSEILVEVLKCLAVEGCMWWRMGLCQVYFVPAFPLWLPFVALNWIYWWRHLCILSCILV